MAETPVFVIVAYRPKLGQEAALRALVQSHVPRLRDWGLATDTPPHIMQAVDGTIVEVFEWAPGAIARAHSDSRVAGMWAEFAAACDYVKLNSLAETSQLFAEFIPL